LHLAIWPSADRQHRRIGNIGGIGGVGGVGGVGGIGRIGGIGQTLDVSDRPIARCTRC
jgi:hypothetical protein